MSLVMLQGVRLAVQLPAQRSPVRPLPARHLSRHWRRHSNRRSGKVACSMLYAQYLQILTYASSRLRSYGARGF